MRAILIGTVVAAALAMASPSAWSEEEPEEESQYYIATSGFFVSPNDSDGKENGVSYSLNYDDGYGAAIAVGHRVTDAVSIEVELAHRSFDLESFTLKDDAIVYALGEVISVPEGTYELDSKLTALSLMTNAIYSFGDAAWGLSPYLGAGIGITKARLGEIHSDEGVVLSESVTDGGIAFQLMTGVLYSLADDIDLKLGYRYFGTESLGSVKLSSHNVEFGVVVSF